MTPGEWIHDAECAQDPVYVPVFDQAADAGSRNVTTGIAGHPRVRDAATVCSRCPVLGACLDDAHRLNNPHTGTEHRPTGTVRAGLWWTGSPSRPPVPIRPWEVRG